MKHTETEKFQFSALLSGICRKVAAQLEIGPHLQCCHLPVILSILQHFTEAYSAALSKGIRSISGSSSTQLQHFSRVLIVSNICNEQTEQVSRFPLTCVIMFRWQLLCRLLAMRTGPNKYDDGAPEVLGNRLWTI